MANKYDFKSKTYVGECTVNAFSPTEAEIKNIPYSFILLDPSEHIVGPSAAEIEDLVAKQLAIKIRAILVKPKAGEVTNEMIRARVIKECPLRIKLSNLSVLSGWRSSSAEFARNKRDFEFRSMFIQQVRNETLTIEQANAMLSAQGVMNIQPSEIEVKADS